jgi:SAM-dependent methyltransferase
MKYFGNEFLMNDYPKLYEKEQVINYVKSVNWNKRLENEIPFITNLFRSNNYKNICDLGCGPGFHAIQLAKMNSDFHLTGFDIDGEMISFANQTKQLENLKNITFIQGNFLNLNREQESLQGSFDAIYTLGNALMIIWSTNEEFSAFEIFIHLSALLKSGGGLFFQILNSDAPRNGHVVSNISQNEDGENQILVKHFLAVEDKLYTTFSTIRFNSGEKVVKVSDSRKGFLKLIPLAKLKNQMEEAGFKDFYFYENYSGSSLSENSDSLLCFAKKS